MTHASNTPGLPPNACPVCQQALPSRDASAPSTANHDGGQPDIRCPHCGCLVQRSLVALEAVQKICARTFGVTPDRITASTTLFDLGADSLTTIELLMALESDLGVSFSEEFAYGLETVGDVVAYAANPERGGSRAS